MDDEALLSRARHGDREAFTQIVSRYQDQLYNMSLQLLGNPAEAADVVQETFFRAYTNVPKLRGITLRAWLYRVAINASRDVWRQRQRHPSDSLETEAALDVASHEEGPEATAMNREKWQEVRRVLLDLPVDFRQVLVLRHLSELSYEEISASLRIPVGTVRSRLNRARAMLAEALNHGAITFAGKGGLYE